MSARILVVDDIETNRRVLEARLSAEYFDVISASSGRECLEIAEAEQPDLILLDIMMPGLDGFETCRQLKANRETRHIPVVMVTALDQRDDRVKGLRAGADDFLTKPVDDVALFARVRSLLRLKQVMDELRLRDQAPDVHAHEETIEPLSGHIIIAAGEDRIASHIKGKLPDVVSGEAFSDPKAAMDAVNEHCDLVLIDLSAKHFDGLRLAARIRSDARTRNLPILAVVDGDGSDQMVRALDLGVNDVVNRPIDSGELEARIATQIRQRQYADQLRDRLEESLEMAVTDPLTGLYNRRYVNSRLRQAVDTFSETGETVSLVLFDIDHFKSVNDTYGHNAGDFVLKTFSSRLKDELRAIDIAGRYGGEEFLLILLGAPENAAVEAAERVRAAIARQAFTVKSTGDQLNITVSAGVAEIESGDGIEQLVSRADTALYEAKSAGRNQVMRAKKKAA